MHLVLVPEHLASGPVPPSPCYPRLTHAHIVARWSQQGKAQLDRAQGTPSGALAAISAVRLATAARRAIGMSQTALARPRTQRRARDTCVCLLRCGWRFLSDGITTGAVGPTFARDYAASHIPPADSVLSCSQRRRSSCPIILFRELSRCSRLGCASDLLFECKPCPFVCI